MKRHLIWISLLPILVAAALSAAVSMPPWLLAALITAAGISSAALLLQQQKEARRLGMESLVAACRHSALPLLVLNTQGRPRLANTAFLQLAGLAPDLPILAAEQLLPAPWLEFAARVAAQAQGKGAHSEEIMLPRGERTALLRAHALATQNLAEQPATVLIWEDIGGQSNVLHEALQREKAQLARTRIFIQTLIDNVPYPVYIKRQEGNQGRYQMINAAFCTFHQRSRGSLLGLSAADLLQDSGLVDTILREDQHVLEGHPLSLEREMVNTSTGRPLHTQVNKQACVDPEGHSVVIGVNVDITPWRAAEQNLKVALEREVQRREQVQSFIQRLIDMIPYPVHLKDSRGCYQMVNDAFVHDRGCNREQLLGKDSIEVARAVDGHLLGADSAKWERAQLSVEEDNSVLAGKTVVKEEHNTHPVTGAERFRTVFKGGGLDADGLPVIVTTFFDVTKWRLAERALADSLEREKGMHERTQDFLQRLVDLIPQEFFVKDAESRYVLVNHAFLQRRGVTREQTIGHSMEEVATASCLANPLYQADPDLQAAALRDHQERIRISREEDARVLQGHTVRKEDHHVLPHSGEERFFEVIKMVLRDAGGRPVIVCANFDITALRQAQRQILAMQDPRADSPFETTDGKTPPLSQAPAC